MSLPPDRRLSSFSLNLWASAYLLALLTMTFGLYAWSEKEIDRANDQRHLSFLLADELRQSSDDLTRLARTYVVTGIPSYKQHYQDILDIRDGKKPRPEEYQRVYWDLILADGRPPRPDSQQTVALLDLMRQAGFTDAEFQKLEQAKENSDGLTATEFAAMKLAESTGPGAEADRARARLMMFDNNYHQAKAAIMRPIDEFYGLMDQRTRAAVDATATRATILRLVFIALGLGLFFMLWRTYASLRATLGGSVTEVHAQINRIGSGDFSSPIPSATAGSVLRWLSETQVKLGEIDGERKAAEDRVQRLAHFDQLTELPNRVLLGDRITHAISMAQRKHEQLAILFLDIDHFKHVNDTLGHRFGDELLLEIATRLKSVVRDEDTVARQGGDEFVLVLPDTDVNGAAHVAGKLLEVIAQRYRIEQYELVVTSSIGIAMYPSNGEDFGKLSQCADVAMYRAKQDGRNNFRFFTPEMQTHSVRTLQLENALRRAVEHDELSLHYQPQLSLRHGPVIGAEALLRWHSRELGVVAPAEFIPIAEASGQILQIGEWVLRSAARQLKTWMDSGLAPMIMAVNLSSVQFRQPKLPELVTQVLDEVGLSPQYLEFELTEGAAMDDPVHAIAVMDDLHRRGIRMAIDDFGTGYSSLSHLKRFHVYKLKIDQSFVRDITEDSEDKAIVAAIISLATSLGMRTIAEGVETEGQLAFLRDSGCDEVQGYYFGKPMPADQFEAFVRSRERP